MLDKKILRKDRKFASAAFFNAVAVFCRQPIACIAQLVVLTMLNVEWILGRPRLGANHHHRSVARESKAHFVPDVRVVKGDVGQADFRCADILFDGVYQNGNSVVLVYSVRL